MSHCGTSKIMSDESSAIPEQGAALGSLTAAFPIPPQLCDKCNFGLFVCVQMCVCAQVSMCVQVHNMSTCGRQRSAVSVIPQDVIPL